MVWLPVFGIFNVHTNVDACDFARGPVYEPRKRFCTRKIPYRRIEIASVLLLSFGLTLWWHSTNWAVVSHSVACLSDKVSRRLSEELLTSLCHTFCVVLVCLFAVCLTNCPTVPLRNCSSHCLYCACMSVCCLCDKLYHLSHCLSHYVVFVCLINCLFFWGTTCFIVCLTVYVVFSCCLFDKLAHCFSEELPVSLSASSSVVFVCLLSVWQTVSRYLWGTAYIIVCLMWIDLISFYFILVRFFFPAWTEAKCMLRCCVCLPFSLMFLSCLLSVLLFQWNAS